MESVLRVQILDEDDCILHSVDYLFIAITLMSILTRIGCICSVPIMGKINMLNN